MTNIITDSLALIPTTTDPTATANVRGTNGDTTTRFSVDVYQKSTDAAQYGDAMRINTGAGRAKGGINYTSKGLPAIVYSTLDGPFNIQTTDTLILKIDGVQYTVTFSGVTAGAATTGQVCDRINAVVGFPLQAIATYGGDSDYFRLATQTLGDNASIEIVGGTARANLGLAVGTTYGEPVASPARFIPGTTDGVNRYSPYNLNNGDTLIITVGNRDKFGNNVQNTTTVTFSTSGPTPITAGAATWQEVVAAINAVAVGFYAFPVFDPKYGVRVGVQSTTYSTGVTLTIGSGTGNTALGYVATSRSGGDGTSGEGRQLIWGVHHFLPNNETTSVEHWHWSMEAADDEGKARTRFEIKFLADVCRVIYTSCYVILNSCTLYVAKGSGENADIMFNNGKEPQPKNRYGGLRSRASAATGSGRAAGSEGDVELMTSDSSGNLQTIFIAHRLTDFAVSMRCALMWRQRTTQVAAASALTLSPSNGNVFFINGTTAINTINRTGWQAGSEILLHFQPATAGNATATVNHSTAVSTATVASIQLAGGVNMPTAEGYTLRLQLVFNPQGTPNDTTSWFWKEISRSPDFGSKQNPTAFASASNLAIKLFQGNVLFVSGNTTINTISIEGTTIGTQIELHFQGTPTITHATTAATATEAYIRLVGGISWSTVTSGALLGLRLMNEGGTIYWKEVYRRAA